MESLRVERLDHLGLIASVIKELRVIEMIDARLVPDAQEEITPGEAMAGMILNGLGFGNRPLSLTPQFFANTPLDLLFREGVHAELFNRFKLGRTLDEVSAYGCDLLFSELALAVCVQEGIDQRFNHLDTTSCSLSGDYVPESDEHAMHITYGDSKDHRPDLTQAVLELMVSPRWRGALGEPKLGWSRVGYEDFPGAGRGADGDLSTLAHAALSGGRLQTVP